MNINEKDLYQNVEAYLLSLGCTITKQETWQGSVSADMIGSIINKDGILEDKVVVEIKFNPSPAAQKQLFTIAKKFNTPFILLAVMDDNSKLKYYWFETESGLPIAEPTFVSTSKYVISETDIEQTIWNALNLMREMAARYDESIEMLLSLLLVRVYLFEHKQLNRWNSLNEEELKCLMSKAAAYYNVIEYDTTRLILGNRIRNLLSILNSLPAKSEKYHIILASLIQKNFGREMGISGTPINLLNIIGRLSKCLRINNNSVMNIGSGMGSLLREVRNNTSADMYTGVELNTNVVSQSKMINIICGYDDIKIENMDAFKINDAEKYKLIITNPPIGVKVRKDNIKGLKIAEGRGMINISEAFIEKAINITSIGGYIIAVIQDGSLFSGVSKPIRDIILERTVVKAIISLPEHIFRPYTNVKSSILILEKSENSIIKPKNLFIGRFDSIDDTDEVLNAFEKWFNEEGIYVDNKGI